MFLVLSLLLLLFPNGRLTSRNWSVAALTALIGSVLLTLWWTTQPGPLYLYPSIENPFGIGGTPGTSWKWEAGSAGWSFALA